MSANPNRSAYLPGNPVESETETTPTELVPVDEAVALERVQYDIQIMTARKVGRDVALFLKQAESMVQASPEVAEGCFYSLKRGDKLIEGPSIRLAEIAKTCWGHMLDGARILDIGDRFVKVQGFAWDMFKNNRTTTEVIRRITNKSGARYNDDMIGVTTNAALSIAKRNAVISTIPRVYIYNLMREAQKVASGNALALPEKRRRWLEWFTKLGVPENVLLAYLEVTGLEAIDLTHIRLMVGVKQALEDGETTIEAEFAAATAACAKPTKPAVPSGVQKEVKPEPAPPAAVAEQPKAEPQAQGQGEVTQPKTEPPAGETTTTLTVEPEAKLTFKGMSVYDALRKQLADDGVAQNQFIAWAVSKRLLTNRTQDIGDIAIRKVTSIVANWNLYRPEVVKFQME